MVTWNNLDKLASFEELKKVERVNLAEVMSGENGAERVKSYSVPMAEGLAYNYAAKQVNEDVLAALVKLAEEAQLSEKFEELYNGAVINTGENRLVLHQLTRGQLGNTVTADGVDKRAFYVEQQNRIAEFANKVHAGEITNAAGEKFTTVVQIGIGGSDLGPRAMYLALENWAKKNGCFKMEAKFISNVDPADAAAVLNSIDVAHSIFVLVSKSGTTLETLTNESFVKDALKNAGLDASKHMIAVTSETSPLAKSDDYLAAFFMDDYIGGRYSSTSAVGGAVLSLAFGPEVFAAFLEGAAAEDKLSANKDVLQNPEMLDALIGVYERNVLGYPSTAVLPYSQALNRFPAHLQQVDMEFFFGRNAVEFLKHQKHRLIVNRDKSIVFAPEQRCMAVADLVADLCRLLFVTRSKGNADHLARRRIDGDDFFIVCIEHITLIQTPCENGIVHADSHFCSFVCYFFMYFLKCFVPFDIYIFYCFSCNIKIMKLS